MTVKKSALFILLKHRVIQVSNSWSVVKKFTVHEMDRVLLSQLSE